MPKPIGYHFTMLTVNMVMNGVLHPRIIRVESPEQALSAAKKIYKSEVEATFGCMTAFDDGSLSHQIYTMSELDF